jgi:hypothetical protein
MVVELASEVRRGMAEPCDPPAASAKMIYDIDFGGLPGFRSLVYYAQSFNHRSLL